RRSGPSSGRPRRASAWPHASTSRTEVAEPAVTVGRITKAHGVHGEGAVENHSDTPDRWVPGAVVFGRDGRELTVRTVRPHGPRLLVTFEGVEERTAAEHLAGSELQGPRVVL